MSTGPLDDPAADDAQQEMYASQFDAGVMPSDIIEACMRGAQNAWPGEVRLGVDDGSPLIEFVGSRPEGEAVVEACTLAIALVEGRHRLLTMLVVNARPLESPRSWTMHCDAVERLNRDPVAPARGDVARRLYDDSQGHFLSF